MFILKKSFLFIATVSVSSFLIGSQKCGSDVKSLYSDLLTLQGTANPMKGLRTIRAGHFDINANTYTQNSRDIFNGTLAIFKDLFSKALTTGLMVQYKQLILSNNEKITNAFLDKQHLQIIAYMQNVYGGGQPFKYDSTKGPETSYQADNSPTLGIYKNPQGQDLMMTRYSVLNGIIDAMIALDSEGKASDPNYKKFCDTFKINLLEAIKIATRQNLLEIEDNIGPSYSLDTRFQSNLKSIIGSITQLKNMLPKSIK